MRGRRPSAPAVAAPQLAPAAESAHAWGAGSGALAAAAAASAPCPAPAAVPAPALSPPAAEACGAGERWWAELRAVLEEVLERKLCEAGLSDEAQAQKEQRQQTQLQKTLQAWVLENAAQALPAGMRMGSANGSPALQLGDSQPYKDAHHDLDLVTEEPPQPTTSGTISSRRGSAASVPGASGGGGPQRCWRREGSVDVQLPQEPPPAPQSAPAPRPVPEALPPGRRVVLPAGHGEVHASGEDLSTVLPAGHGEVHAWGERKSEASQGSSLKRDSTRSLVTVSRGSVASDGFWNSLSLSSNRTSLQKFEAGGSTGCCSSGGISRMVKSQYFDWAVGIFTILNAASIGIQTDIVASTMSLQVPLALRLLEAIFCGIFTLELALRVLVYRTSFFTGRGWCWNLFDSIVVGLQLMEEILSEINGGDSEVLPSNMSFARVLRILRLVRVIRLVRILRLIRELRTLVSSISNSMRSLGWTVLLLLLMIYTFGLYITQLVADHLIHDAEGPGSAGMGSKHTEDLQRYYGSVSLSMLSLFQSITGGVDWDILVHPLTTEISPWLAVIFVIFIAFAVLAMMNVVTGVFVESVLLSAKADKDVYTINSARDIFKTVVGGMNSGALAWDQFQSPQMRDFFRHIDVDPSDARSLFRLLDVDGSGTIEANEFLDGCIRLRGPAKALDTAAIREEVRTLSRKIQELKVGEHQAKMRAGSCRRDSCTCQRSVLT